MKRPDIEIAVDELVVIGFGGRDAAMVAEAMRRELAVLAMTWDTAPTAAFDRTRPALEVRVVPGMTADALGSQVAHALHHHLAPAEPPGAGA